MKINYNYAKKCAIIFSSLFVIFIVFIFLFYFVILPRVIKSQFLISFAQKITKEHFDMVLEIKNPNVKTMLKPEIEFAVDKICLSKNNKKLFSVDNFEMEIQLSKIIKREINLEKIETEKIFIDFSNLISNLPKQKKKSPVKPSFFIFNLNNSEIEIDNLDVLYSQNNSFVNMKINDIELKDNKLAFDCNVDILKKNEKLINLQVNADNQIKFLDNKINISNLLFAVNHSKIVLDSEIDFKNFLINIKSNNFHLNDIFKIIYSDLIIPNGETILAPLNKPSGNISFDIKLNNGDLLGNINVNNTCVQIKDVSNIPIKIQKGNIEILKDKILFKDLIGFYGKNKLNKVSIKGDIKDYYKSFDSNIEVESLITNEFFNDYLSKLINNTKFFVSKPSKTKIIYKSKNNIMDIIWFAQIDKGVDFGITNEKSALSDYDRAILGEFQIDGNKLNIKNINYYIASNIVRGVKLQPIIQAKALLDFSGKIDKAGFAFGREMPCEFLNIFLGQNIFKKGTIKGNIDIVFKNNIPYLNADMEIKKTLIPSQRMSIKHAVLKTDNKLININAKGRFKRASYEFVGKIKNEFKEPYIIKNLSLSLDNLDIERILNSFNSSKVQNAKAQEYKIATEDDLIDDNFMFNTNLIRIEDCNFVLTKGNYKELTFGNIKAKLTLDDKGILKVFSNKFDIAQGISTLKVVCNLQKMKYYIRLGVKNIDSNLMAKTLFNLDKEVTGKADGIIELFGDETLKLNGDIKFAINEGTIGKVGLVEYLLKVASVFRNPIVMVSPATIIDIVSIPEGKFDKIIGTIKICNNVLAPIDIKSYSSSLSALIKGKFDLERHDASIRIYTRFSTDKKSIFGILRQFSLNSLANKIKKNSNNDANYYESELSQLPQIDVEENKTQVFLTQVEGDIEHFNFLSSLKRIK